MPSRSRTIRNRFPHDRAGFTLVEMLVATALTVLIMLMFAQIYGSAVGSITEQRALANNDQKARRLETTLRSDLQSMTYRQPRFPYGDVAGIVPLAAGDEAWIDPIRQRGFFYYSENDWDNQTDDVLQFTVMLRAGLRGDAETRDQRRPYTGNAGDLGTGAPNQPKADDGNSSNGQGSSRAAEIVYFLRNGNLYRRVLLLRDPQFAPSPRAMQPGTLAGVALFNPKNASSRDYSTGSGEFYRDFDYSATRFFDASSGPSALWFNSLDSLSNHLGLRNVPIALPWNRFGHFNDPSVSADHMMPREFIEQVPGTEANDDDKFIGRFTQQETAHKIYDYPGAIPGKNYNQRSVDLTFNTSTSNKKLIDGLHDQSFRIAEDLLLTDVTEFNVEVFDPTADSDDDGDAGPSSFQDLGHALQADNSTTLNNNQPKPVFGQSQRDNTGYGPRTGGVNRIFDSWHPSIGATTPFRPLHSELQYGNNDVDVRVFTDWNSLPTGMMQSAAPRGAPDNLPSATRTMLFPVGWNRSLGFEWRGGNLPGSKEPEWPRTPGAIVQDGGITWECVDNRIGLEAIRVTIRFSDPRSRTPRQVTLVHSFVE